MGTYFMTSNIVRLGRGQLLEKRRNVPSDTQTCTGGSQISERACWVPVRLLAREGSYLSWGQ